MKGKRYLNNTHTLVMTNETSDHVIRVIAIITLFDCVLQYFFILSTNISLLNITLILP